MEQNIQFAAKSGEFVIHNPKAQSMLYLPVGNENGIKSSVTQNFGGDCKIDQNTFVLEPVSVENLHNNRSTRNIWCRINDKDVYSLTGVSAQAEYERFLGKNDDVTLRAGFMWQESSRVSKQHGISAQVRLFAPLGYPAEVLSATVHNDSDVPVKIQITGAIPIYGRSADNLRDHRHVTALLHRIRTTEHGVCCKPVLSFDERGHQRNSQTYFVFGSEENGGRPLSYFPTVESFIGEGGSFLAPEALQENKSGCPAGAAVDGEEALGGIVFPEIVLAPQESRSYTFMIGVTDKEQELVDIPAAFATKEQAEQAFNRTKEYWQKLVNVSFTASDSVEDNYLKWICFQPILRRIYGCSFLPYHDYGKGGRGWRDLWQDCLSLLIMNPSDVRSMILNSFAGVRMDGTNATIIGAKPGEFVADRNNITRVWMDHAYWPFVTTKLYIDQTGDIGILDELVAYFKDAQTGRGTQRDVDWNGDYGTWQRTEAGAEYRGSVLEHILIQNLCAFYEAGEHNSIRLRGADWNDAIDMAEENGESVAFTCAYIGNLNAIADLLAHYKTAAGRTAITVAREMEVLFGQTQQEYESPEARRQILTDYTAQCRHNISGEQITLEVDMLIEDLRKKAAWYASYIRENEWVEDGNGHGWFNGYYDNSGRAVEGVFGGSVRMMLTGQVFSIMGGVADDTQVRAICESADTYLYKKEVGGYRLNTDFAEEKFDMGRMFGFAYGEKENGAVFSHMSVMYANALYQRGFVQEGDKVLRALMDQAKDSETSAMYPGIPEYFDAKGKGKYAYLTGAASWYMLTLVTQVYGFRGEQGDLVIEPKLLASQFDADGKAVLRLQFQGKSFCVTYENPRRQEYGNYVIREVRLDGRCVELTGTQSIRLPQQMIAELGDITHSIELCLA